MRTGVDLHQSHPELIKRLKRANGHLQNVVEMMESGRDCALIAQQLYAVERAVGAAKKLLIHDHLDHCLAHAVTEPGGARDAFAELKNITKYL